MPKYEDLDATAKEELVSNGISLLQSLTTHFGSDQGLEAWDKFCEVIDPGIKGDIFFAMLMGKSGHTVYLQSPPAGVTNAVAVIKTIREYACNGLKEAKDLYDYSKSDTVSFKVENGTRLQCMAALRNLGCRVW